MLGLGGNGVICVAFVGKTGGKVGIELNLDFKKFKKIGLSCIWEKG